MKILAIRGKNLASLAGEFELRFHQGPLATTGLFAICGPTGSGKSTLLDALCLALYDETPRLTRATVKGISLPDVGEETITPQDPRNLLRRRAGEGFAEVDFLGNDGIQYRARWSVRRARGKADGKLQNTEMLLETLDGGQRIGGVKNEVQQAIRERLGLSFPQFTRAVLLAQNEFATFLKANDNERAELLETLTGLDVYTGISIRAFERARNEQKALEALQAQLAGQQPLDAEARVGLERSLAAARTETGALEQRKTELDRRLQWHDAWEKLKQAEQQARDEAQKARAARENAAPRQVYFARVEAVQDARPRVTEADRIAGEVAKHSHAVAAAEGDLARARHVRQQADEALTQAAQGVAVAEQAKTAAGADLDRAKALDAAIELLVPRHADAANALAEARQAEARAQKNLTGKQAERDRIGQELRIARDWLSANEPSRILAEDWPRWDLLFDEAAKTQNDLRDADQAIATLRRDEPKHRQGRDQAAATLARAEAVLQSAETALQAAIQALAGFDPDGLATNRAAAETRRERLARAERLWTTLAGSLARQRELDAEAGALREKIARAETALTQLLADKPAAAVRLEQAERSLKIAEAACAKNVETLRAALETGSPCPVCGATEHPYAAGDAPSRAMLAGLKVDMDECRKGLDALVRQEAAQQAAVETGRQRLAAIAGEREPLAAAIQRDTDAWNAQPVAAELTPVAPADRPAWFVAQNESARERLTAIAREEDALRQAGKARDETQQARDAGQRRQAAARDALNAAQAVLDRTVQAIQTAGDRRVEAARRSNERLTALDAAFAGEDWRSNWQADPAAFHRARREQARQWSAQTETVNQRQTTLSQLDIECQALAQAAAEKTTLLQDAAAGFEKVDRDLQDKRRQRQALFAGRPIAEVEAALARAVQNAEAGRQQQDQAARKAAQAQASAEAVLGQARQTLAAGQHAAEQADATLNAWIAAFDAQHPEEPLDSARLRALLARDGAWIAAERKALQKLADDVGHAEMILQERRFRRETHERQRATPDPADAVQTAWTQAAADLEQARQRAIEAELALRQDDERKIRTAELQGNIDQQEAKARIWGQLNDLIGSADGKKFRNYAQQFTLDVLLGYANRHLADLSRRYRLERVKDTLALMVVDQDMGDEYRSVHSLSGGESFLVSLALALGLASLSSNRVQVESLFIDEGFGSLDTDTLRVAMDALDNLQAQGRKVGVISHVQEMTERIGIQIQVRRQSGGQSRIEVTSA
ncbi:MAG: AAA family ATPase [Candidatus Competibacter sp.]|nr:AAA family ATPase [Candidatus Competibacter sp.]